MKCRATPVIAFLIIFSALPLGAARPYWGLTGGMNITGVYPEFTNVVSNGIPQQFSSLNRTVFGVIFGLPLGKNLMLQVEPSISQKGGEISGDLDLDIKYSVLECPLLLKLTWGTGVQPFMFFGPSLSVLLKSEWIFNLNGIGISGNARSISSLADLSMIFGAGIQFPVWKGYAFVSGRYNLGLISLVRGGQMDLQYLGYDIAVEIDEGENVYAEGFQFMMGFTFPLGKNPGNGE